MLLGDLIHKSSSFKGFCDSYNFCFNIEKLKRNTLNIKRLIECFFYYNLLVYIKNSSVMSLGTFQAPYNHKLDDAIELIRPNLLPNFIKKWTGPHHSTVCKSKKCSAAVNVDGIWKISRLKCAFQNIGMQSPELPNIIVGCKFSPAPNSYYCEDHKQTEECLYIFVNGKQQTMRISAIVATQIDHWSKVLKIHDLYCDDEDRGIEKFKNKNVLYLVELANKKICWVKPSNLDKKMLGNFQEGLIIHL